MQTKKVIRCKHGSNCIYMKKDNCNFYHPQEDYMEDYDSENMSKKLKLNIETLESSTVFRKSSGYPLNISSSIFLDIPSQKMVSALNDLKETYCKNYDELKSDISDIYDTIDSIKMIKSTTNKKKLNDQIFKTNEEIKNLIMNIVISNKDKIKQEKSYNITSILINKYKGGVKYLFRFIFGGPRFKNAIDEYEYDNSYWILQNIDLPMDSLKKLLKSHGFKVENIPGNQYKINLFISCI